MKTKANNPIFSDLSSYSPKTTIPFYEKVFKWKFYEEYNYHTAYNDNQPVIGLYETPEKFKKMNMPHFWMTYIQVNSVEKTVEQAKKLGGIIEMTETISGFGKVALIRDPQGAGFIIYEGAVLKSTRTINTPNTLVWNELHVSDINKVLPFYQGIFNWTFNNSNGGLEIYNNLDEYIADFVEIPNQMKGKYEYWISSFGVKDLLATKTEILSLGGSLIVNEGNKMLFTDNSGEAFFYITKV